MHILPLSMRPLASLASVAAAMTVIALASPALAAVSMTTGAGSAVSQVDASAAFESVAALNGNPYLEGGLSFTRTGLSFENNGCGYAGCGGHAGFTGFTGNYMYGAGSGYFEIRRADGGVLSGLEFILGSGLPPALASVSWTAFLQGAVVGSGSAYLPAGTVLGFSGGGFDTFRYTDIATNNGLPNVPAFDSVSAQFQSAAAVPEPGTWAVMILGFGLTGAAMRRRSRSTLALMG